MNNSQLASQAAAVLRSNDAGNWTKPSIHLYPHQWNWDSALISIGWAWLSWERAVREIESLLEAQWENGMIPHIRYDEQYLADYFPGPDRWPNLVRHHPAGVLTSGISNPPVLVMAARRLGELAPNAIRRDAFLARVFPALEHWLRYFAQQRRLDGCPLVTVVHPWETGWDNSPRWDHLRAAGLRPKRPFIRRDTRYVSAEHRPDDHDYEGYMALMDILDESDYSIARYREASPFMVNDVFFDACWYRAADDVNAIADVLNLKPPFAPAELAEFGAAFEERHWEPQLQDYLDYDIVAGRRIQVPTPAGIAATLSGLVPTERARLMWDAYTDEGGVLRPVWTVSPRHPSFDPVRYWRGPVWVNLNWLIALGLSTTGLGNQALALEQSTLELLAKSGFHEHYSPVDDNGAGGANFSWSAAVALDLLGRRIAAE